MSKKIKYTIWAFFTIILLILIFLAVTIKKNANPINRAAQPANQTQRANQAQQASQQASQQAAQQAKQRIASTSVPVYTKEVKVEFMTDAEKLTMSLPAALKIQVLERDKTGKVTAYKIIRQDSDIMTKYGN